MRRPEEWDLVGKCEQQAGYFADKINRIYSPDKHRGAIIGPRLDPNTEVLPSAPLLLVLALVLREKQVLNIFFFLLHFGTMFCQFEEFSVR